MDQVVGLLVGSCFEADDIAGDQSVVRMSDIRPWPECSRDVVAVIELLLPWIGKEPGCEFCALLQTAEALVLVERWTDPGALEAHLLSESHSILLDTIASFLAEPVNSQLHHMRERALV